MGDVGEYQQVVILACVGLASNYKFIHNRPKIGWVRSEQ